MLLTRSRLKQFLRRRWAIISIPLLVTVAATTLHCIAPAAFKAVQMPRAGRPIEQHVCIVYSDRYQIRLGGLERLHPFDINKYSKIYLALLQSGLIRPEDVFVPDEISRADLLRVHSEEYLDVRLADSALVSHYLEAGIAGMAPSGVLDSAILKPFRIATGGTLLAARLALEYGMAVNLGGGYHHAEPDQGGGFCIYADMPVAIRTLQAEGKIRRALIVDVDVHQGNGTALCVAADDDVFTFDMHEGDIYPIPKEKNDIDIPLPPGTGDDEYLAVLKSRLPAVFDRFQPDIIFEQAGVDGLAGDPLAHFKLTERGIVQRDQFIFEQAAKRSIPIVMVLGGGYSKRAWHAQFASIRNIITHYGLQDADPPYPSRDATIKEKWQTN